MLTVGQRVWHVGKNVVQKEVLILWKSPEAIAGMEEGAVLVQSGPNYYNYHLIPLRQLSATKPVIRCTKVLTSPFTIRQCILESGHITWHKALLGFEDAEVVWPINQEK